MSVTRKLIVLGLLLVAVLGLAACSKGASGGGPEVAVTMEEWKITPAEVKIPAGGATLVISNKGTQPHDLGVEGQKVASQLLQANKTEKLAINLPKGTYNLVCTVAGHKESGMVAKLIVE